MAVTEKWEVSCASFRGSVTLAVQCGVEESSDNNTARPAGHVLGTFVWDISFVSLVEEHASFGCN